MILHLAFQIGGPNNYVPIRRRHPGRCCCSRWVISVLTGVIFGIAPAWMTSHADPVGGAARREPFGGRAGARGHRSRW